MLGPFDYKLIAFLYTCSRQPHYICIRGMPKISETQNSFLCLYRYLHKYSMPKKSWPILSDKCRFKVTCFIGAGPVSLCYLWMGMSVLSIYILSLGIRQMTFKVTCLAVLGQSLSLGKFKFILGIQILVQYVSLDVKFRNSRQH